MDRRKLLIAAIVIGFVWLIIAKTHMSCEMNPLLRKVYPNMCRNTAKIVDFLYSSNTAQKYSPTEETPTTDSN